MNWVSFLIGIRNYFTYVVLSWQYEALLVALFRGQSSNHGTQGETIWKKSVLNQTNTLDPTYDPFLVRQKKYSNYSKTHMQIFTSLVEKDHSMTGTEKNLTRINKTVPKTISVDKNRATTFGVCHPPVDFRPHSSAYPRLSTLTPAHSRSLPLTPAHSRSLTLTPAHSCTCWCTNIYGRVTKAKLPSLFLHQ